MLCRLSAIGPKRLNLYISFSSVGVALLSCPTACTDRHRVHRVVISGQVAVSQPQDDGEVLPVALAATSSISSYRGASQGSCK